MTALATAALRGVRRHALTTAAGAALVALAADEALRATAGQRTLTGATIRQLTTPTSPTRIALGQLGR